MRITMLPVTLALTLGCESEPPITYDPDGTTTTTTTTKTTTQSNTETPTEGGDEGGSRLKVLRYVGTDGSKISVGIYDEERNEMCSYRRTADGTRCLPAGAIAAVYFQDAGCTKPLVSVTTVSCSAAKYVFVGDPCAVTIHEIGGDFKGMPFIGAPGMCQQIGVQPNLHLIGAEIPLGSFVEVASTEMN